jgi:hypothetical protein
MGCNTRGRGFDMLNMTMNIEGLKVCLTNIMELYNIMNDSGIINKEGL